MLSFSLSDCDIVYFNMWRIQISDF